MAALFNETDPDSKTGRKSDASPVTTVQKGGAKTKSNLIEIPHVALPKGGGAIKGIDEKFSVNAVNGTASFAIPLPFSPSRNSFRPTVSLGYNSGSGSSIFGLGWSLAIPSITRKTDRGLPQYFDSLESDTFILAGQEDMVPVLDDTGKRVTTPVGTATSYPYRPRIENSFDRIERIVEQTGNCYWRIITKDNITSIFGRSKNARIADPQDGSKIFKWLPEFSYDDKGNCYRFAYKPEDLTKVLPALHEANRLSGMAPFTNTYLKRIQYCNEIHFDKTQQIGDWQRFLDSIKFRLQLVLDYGEHDLNDPQPDDKNDWYCRQDPYSDYRAGFEIRTYRLCKRILMFHRFNELGQNPCLIRSMDLNYSESNYFSFLQSVTQKGYKKAAVNGYTSKALPALEFIYEPLGWNTEVKSLTPENLVNAPAGIDDKNYQWVDLYGEGVSGILTEQADTLFYKSNEGGGAFSVAESIYPKPSFSGLASGTVQLTDLEANGKKFLVSHASGGYFELTEESEWLPFESFEEMPNINWQDPNLKMLDLNGDGLADILISEDEVFGWYAAKGRSGYDDYRKVSKAPDEERGPVIVFSDITQSIFLSDMSGDGLVDIVRIRNGEIVYWPNLGYGKFGAKVSMGGAPVFDATDAFNPKYIKLADVDGSGLSDVVYTGKNSYQVYFNQAGNSWSTVNIVKGVNPLPFPSVDSTANVSVIDLLGSGTSCIVWSSPLPGNTAAPLKYIDLMGGKKPHIMTSYVNNLGKQVNIAYKPSTFYYLADKQKGMPWITKLPFPVQCVSSVETVDLISKTRFANLYTYRHGYYDYVEREFRGFGYVEQTDTDTFNGETLDQAPVITKSWFHTGAFLDKEKILTQFRDEYFYNQPGINYTEPQLQDALVDVDLSIDEWREALRACKGMPLRVEIFADDNAPSKHIPYTAAEHNCIIKRIQKKGDNKYAVFMVKERETITFNYEREVDDARIAHTLNTAFDLYGNILETVSVAYGRSPKMGNPDLQPGDLLEQQTPHITYRVNSFVSKDIVTGDDYRLRLLCETASYELTDPFRAPGALYQPDEIKGIFDGSATIAYEISADNQNRQKRLVEDERHYFRDNVNDVRLPLGDFQSLALPFETYKLAFTLAHAQAFSDNKFTDALLLQASYIKLPDNPSNSWLPSGRQAFDTANFFQVVQITDPFHKITSITYDAGYHFYISQVQDPAKNINSVTGFDFVVLQPAQFTDLNQNISEVAFDTLGIVTGMALKGKGNEADDLNGFNADITQAQTDAFFNDPLNQAPGLLQHATGMFIYDFSQKNVCIATIAREEHFAVNANAAVQVSFEYYDGLGQVLQKKVRAESGDALKVVNGQKTTVPGQDPRWIGSGTVIRNNKNNPIKKYEEFFSTTHLLEDDDVLKKIGVTPLIQYDPIGRVIQTTFPDTTFSTVEYYSWKQFSFDQNDNVQASGWFKDRITNPVPAIATPDEVDAAGKAALHDGTPAQAYFDSLGRTFLTLTVSVQGQASKFRNRIVFDIEGNQLSVTDAKGNEVMSYRYNMLGTRIFQNSMDAGVRITLPDVAGKPSRSWDSKSQEFVYSYDDLHRPLETSVTLSNNTVLLFDKIIYGETLLNGPQRNLCGQIYQHYDTAGLVQNDMYDFKSNLVATFRKVLKNYTDDADWNRFTDADLDTPYTTINTYDALNRIQKTTVHNSNALRYEFGVGGLLEKVFASVNKGDEKPYVKDIDYDEKSRRSRIVYGNDTITAYVYDEVTFRLKRLTTTDKNNNVSYQDQNYTYDPVGNITRVRDNAQQDIFFDGTKVEPLSSYTYDALYQLTKAIGREHIGQNDIDESRNNLNYRSFPFKTDNIPAPGDAVAMRGYTQTYTYDEASNITIFDHLGTDNVHYTRTYFYNNNDADRLACGVPGGTIKNNRLLRTIVAGQQTNYAHDEHGNLTSMPHLSVVEWTYSDRLKRTAKTIMRDGNPGMTYYAYDAAGMRVRKTTIPQNLVKKKREERIYINGFELYIKYNDDNTESVELQRETLHIMDDKSRVAMVEIKTLDNGTKDKTQKNKNYIRYQYGNHLGSASIELNENLEIVSYEEYHPFGTTSYQAANKIINSVAKRYRYTALERDEENGFGYHNARYYMSWLGRWLSADFKGVVDGFNLYSYSKCNPVKFIDHSGNAGEFPDDPNGLMTPEFILEEKAEEIQASHDYASFKEITRVLNTTGDLDLTAGLSALEGSYTPNDPNVLSYRLQDQNPHLPPNHPAPNVQGIGPVTEYSKDEGQLSHVTFRGKASIDDDGIGPSHNDPDHQALPGNIQINADIVPYAVASLSLLSQLGGGSVPEGLRAIPYGSTALVERGGNVFPALVEDAGPFHSAGEVSVNLAGQIGNLHGFSGHGPVDNSATDVGYHFLRSDTIKPLTANFTAANITQHARDVLSEHLQRRADELFQRILGRN